MSSFDRVRERILLEARGRSCAMAWRDREFTYGDLAGAIARFDVLIEANAIRSGDVVAVVGDFSPSAVAALVALWSKGVTVVPLATTTVAQSPHFLEVAGVGLCLRISAEDDVAVEKLSRVVSHPLLEKLGASGHPGVVIFSSGSTGTAKASLLDVDLLCEKFAKEGKPQRTVSFLLFDHIGGLNTLLATLANGGTLVSPTARDVDTVCRAITRAKAEVLPTSPTFLRMMMMTDAHIKHDLGSLTLVTYGTEPMHETTLRALRHALPGVELKQTYGLTELGIFRTKSKSSDSLWVKVGGEGIETKVEGGILWVRARAAMLGYLNAPSPFDADGWYCTGDCVEVDGEYLLIKGRESEIVNVGGEKVYPAEVESVLMQLDNVRDATVSGKRNAVMGHVVTATIVLETPEDAAAFSRRARAFCEERLAAYKVPVAIEVVEDGAYLTRFKKMRRADAAQTGKSDV